MAALQLDSKHRVLAVDGLVSEEIFRLVRQPDQKLIVVLESPDGKTHRVHQERLIPEDCFEQEIIVSKVLKTVCHRCRKLADICNGHAKCDCGPNRLPVKKSLPESGTTNVKDSIIMANKTPAIVDLQFVASHGIELWSKESKFDHVATEAKSYALLADNPPRKLCFQTYNGSLGKRSNDLARLCLDGFRDNANHNGKPPWSLVKGTLDDERERLRDADYAIMTVECTVQTVPS